MSVVKLTKTVEVCDVGLETCDNRRLHHVRLTVDGRSKTFTLCHAEHAVPFLKMMEQHTKSSRARIYTIEEIEAQRRVEPETDV